MRGCFVDVNVVARGPAGGPCSLGTGVSLERSQVRRDGCSWHRPQGMCEHSLCYWAALPSLPICQSSVTLFLPARDHAPRYRSCLQNASHAASLQAGNDGGCVPAKGSSRLNCHQEDGALRRQNDTLSQREKQ